MIINIKTCRPLEEIMRNKMINIDMTPDTWKSEKSKLKMEHTNVLVSIVELLRFYKVLNFYKLTS